MDAYGYEIPFRLFLQNNRRRRTCLALRSERGCFRSARASLSRYYGGVVDGPGIDPQELDSTAMSDPDSYSLASVRSVVESVDSAELLCTEGAKEVREVRYE